MPELVKPEANAPEKTGTLTKWDALAKRDLSKKKDEFSLHVALIMHQDTVPKSKATFIAWLEGNEGLAKRLKPSPSGA